MDVSYYARDVGPFVGLMSLRPEPKAHKRHACRALFLESPPPYEMAMQDMKPQPESSRILQSHSLCHGWTATSLYQVSMDVASRDPIGREPRYTKFPMDIEFSIQIVENHPPRRISPQKIPEYFL